jgi:hypothetical protein
VAHINTEEEWVHNEKMPCPFCKGADGTDADHWISRCLKIWCASDAGKTFFGIDKAVTKSRELLKNPTLDKVLQLYAAQGKYEETAFALGEMTNLSPSLHYMCALCEDDNYSPNEVEADVALMEFDLAREYLYQVLGEVEDDEILALHEAPSEQK